uniref:UNC93-like protein MFSD11 n=1 Tax=Oncorhynchus tshawytscha TaxID=74940 RepID=A0A8C8IL53_ONCTS
MGPEGKTLLNIIILGFGFMFMFTAFQTCGNIEQTVIKSFNSTEFHGSGYTSMAIIYGVFSASNLIAPSVVAVIGPQLSMFFSGLVYSGYIAMFIHPYTWSFYTAVCSCWNSILWTAQGNLLTINSTDATIGRNSGIFWALLQFSLFFGNMYIYFAWHGHVHISDEDRQTVFISLTVISLVGSFLFFLIQKPDPEATPSEVSESLLQTESTESASIVLTDMCPLLTEKALQLSVTKEMLLLSISIAYTGLELTFYSGVYGTCIGSLIGLSGIFIGLGEILGGGVFGMLNKCNRFGRNPVVLLGLITHFVAFYLIFLNIASDAYITPSVELALLCSFLLGLGDSCFNTHQLLYYSGVTWCSCPLQSITAALAFFYSNYLLLHWQLLIMVVVGFLGTLSFLVAEWVVVSSRRDTDYDSI